MGGFVGGQLKEGRRKNGMVLCRSMLTLDMDYGEPGINGNMLPLKQAGAFAHTTTTGEEEESDEEVLELESKPGFRGQNSLT